MSAIPADCGRILTLPCRTAPNRDSDVQIYDATAAVITLLPEGYALRVAAQYTNNPDSDLTNPCQILYVSMRGEPVYYIGYVDDVAGEYKELPTPRAIPQRLHTQVTAALNCLAYLPTSDLPPLDL